MIANDAPVLCCLAGDKTLNETKLAKQLDAPFRFASDEEVFTYCGASPGFIGPVNLPSDIPIYLDYSLCQSLSYVCGSNENDRHLTSVNIIRDVKLAITNSVMVDIRNAQAGDIYDSPKDDQTGVYTSQRGIEVGHVFKLGAKYSDAMGAGFTNREGRSTSFEMGCYGIGVGRTIAAAIEQSHDAHGIIWPEALAPYDVVVLNLAPNESAVCDCVNQVVAEFESKGKDVIVDDRVESPGVKFKDADLIGIPLQVIIGKKFLDTYQIEIKHRASGEKEFVSLESLNSVGLQV